MTESQTRPPILRTRRRTVWNYRQGAVATISQLRSWSRSRQTPLGEEPEGVGPEAVTIQVVGGERSLEVQVRRRHRHSLDCVPGQRIHQAEHGRLAGQVGAALQSSTAGRPTLRIGPVSAGFILVGRAARDGEDAPAHPRCPTVPYGPRRHSGTTAAGALQMPSLAPATARWGRPRHSSAGPQERLLSEPPARRLAEG